MYSRVMLSLLIVGSVWALQEPTATDQPPPPYILDEMIIEESRNHDEIAEGLFEGDIMLTAEQQKQLLTRKVIAAQQYWWPRSNDGTVDINFRYGDNTINRAGVQVAIDRWEAATCIQFHEIPSVVNSSHLIFQHSATACNSYVGRVFFTAGQPINLTPGCITGVGSAIHEIGHALGLNHEQSRSDRDDYVTIITANIQSGYETNFEKRVTNNFGLPYDYSSVMHYPGNAFGINGQNTIVTKDAFGQAIIGQRTGLSFMDTKIVNLQYQCIDKWLTDCFLTTDPCQNEGYLGSDCACVCPPGTEGSNCQTLRQNYIDAILATLSPNSARVTTETTVTTPNYPAYVRSELAYVQDIMAPECHTVKLTFTAFHFYPKSTTTAGNSICYFMKLTIRKDDPPLTDTEYCGSDISVGQSFESDGRSMVLGFSSRTNGASFTGYNATVEFVRVTSGACADTDTTTPETTTETTTTETPTTETTSTETTTSETPTTETTTTETTTPETTTTETPTTETTTTETPTTETTTTETPTTDRTTTATTTHETTTTETTTTETLTTETASTETTTTETPTTETTTTETTTTETPTTETPTTETTTTETPTTETTTTETTTTPTTTTTTTPTTATPTTTTTIILLPTTPTTTTPTTTTPTTTTPTTTTTIILLPTTPTTTTPTTTTPTTTTTTTRAPTPTGCTTINTGPIKLHASMLGSCSFTEVSATTYKLASPNYPSRYGRLAGCTVWFITEEPRYLRVTPVDVDINDDVLFFFHFYNKFTRMTVGLEGKALIFPTSSSQMTFLAGLVFWGTKFSFNMEVVNSQCHQIINIAVGATCTLSIPDNYPPGTICEWWIRAPPGRRVLVQFSRFDVGDRLCQSDYLAINLAGDKRYISTNIFCGNNMQRLRRVISDRNEINILMNGNNGRYGGFAATYTVL